MSIRPTNSASPAGSSATWKSADAPKKPSAASTNPPSGPLASPTAARADLVVDGADALDWKIERVMAEMRQRALLAGAE
jgi:hypothetical protein